MSNNDDNPRRNLSRPEDNPFIAFRRFADSQVSSLLNTVFTLPATIANHNNAHQAREECLFGKADKRACDKLRELEEEIAGLRQEGRESFRVGDVQAVLRTSEELMRLDRSADDLRKGIVGATTQDSVTDRRKDADMVEQYAHKKGQEFGWMWDWGFPRPFDCDNQTTAITKNDGNREMNELEAMLRLQSEVWKMVADFDGKTWDDRTDNHADNNTGTDEPRVWSWSRSWQWPPPNDAEKDAYSPQALEKNTELKRAGVPWNDAYQDLLREERGEPSRYMRDEPSYEYSHDHEDQHDEPPTPRSEHLSSFPERPTPAYEHMFPFVDTLSQQDIDVMSKDDPLHRRFLELRQQRRRDYMAQLERDGNEFSDAAEAAYSEDDDEEETEMDAYEQLNVAPAQSRIRPAPSISRELRKDAQPSILSTLTTTERIVAPDGSVTTKTVLKKRFADGREESSESVAIQRSQANESHQQDARLEAQKSPAQFEDQGTKNRSTKRPGWFWSS